MAGSRTGSELRTSTVPLRRPCFLGGSRSASLKKRSDHPPSPDTANSPLTQASGWATESFVFQSLPPHVKQLRVVHNPRSPPQPGPAGKEGARQVVSTEERINSDQEQRPDFHGPDFHGRVFSNQLMLIGCGEVGCQSAAYSASQSGGEGGSHMPDTVLASCPVPCHYEQWPCIKVLEHDSYNSNQFLPVALALLRFMAALSRAEN